MNNQQVLIIWVSITVIITTISVSMALSSIYGQPSVRNVGDPLVQCVESDVKRNSIFCYELLKAHNQRIQSQGDMEKP